MIPLWCPFFSLIGDGLVVHMDNWWLKSSSNVVIQVRTGYEVNGYTQLYMIFRLVETNFIHHIIEHD